MTSPRENGARSRMETFLIDVPMPSMGATVSELTVVNLKIELGARVSKGQKIADLESDKSIFEFEAPCEGTVQAVFARPGDVKTAGAVFLRIETSDNAVRHLTVKANAVAGTKAAAPAKALWTPRAIKLAQEAGLDHEKITAIEATGPGGRISGDDVARYLEKQKASHP
jgi:pyruvate/2-oxoglutarate dehydrogenase complex dihydrolipoamide acyltransferase (E2) component